jgi:hypothetical protein
VCVCVPLQWKMEVRRGGSWRLSNDSSNTHTYLMATGSIDYKSTSNTYFFRYPISNRESHLRVETLTGLSQDYTDCYERSLIHPLTIVAICWLDCRTNACSNPCGQTMALASGTWRCKFWQYSIGHQWSLVPK